MTQRPRIDQVLAGFAEGDAISQAAVAMQDAFRSWGCESELFVDDRHVSVSVRDRCKPLSAYQGSPAGIVVHHYSIGSPALDVFAKSPARKILVYHNITPSECFRGFDDAVADSLDHARAELSRVGALVDAVWAVSEFNASELRAAGLKNVKVFPLLFSAGSLDLPPDPMVTGKFTAALKTILFVGRIAPNKKIETLIETFYWYHKLINPFSRLVIVGSERSCPRYFAMLRMQVGDLDLPNVCFEGFASPAGLPAYYRVAEAFLTTSEHEGYCLPLIEAMYMKVPVIARAIGGMPEALNGAGVLYDGLSPNELAGLLHRVLSDDALRAEILASQEKRMQEVKARDVSAELKVLLRDMIPELAHV